MTDPLAALLVAIASSEVRIVDLTHPLSERTPTTVARPEHGQTPPLRRHEVARYDERGPDWAMNWYEMAEHLGTHLDAPIHWRTGRGGHDLASIPLGRLVGPAVVIDTVAATRADPDNLLTVADVEQHVREYGPLPENGWLFVHSGWSERALDQDAFINADANGSHAPGVSPACARWLVEMTPIVGIGVETVGADAGQARTFDPPFPVHSLFLGAGKHTLSQVANLDLLPPRGAVAIVAPLKLVDGTGSPTRALALVPA
jgi:kynurenine formamidase